MKKLFLFALIAILAVSACKESRKNISSAYKDNTEMVGALINNDFIDSNGLSKVIAANGDDAVILDMMLDYNKDPDAYIVDEGLVQTISKDMLKKKLLLLLNNLR
jgi:hypothetical protein